MIKRMLNSAYLPLWERMCASWWLCKACLKTEGKSKVLSCFCLLKCKIQNKSTKSLSEIFIFKDAQFSGGIDGRGFVICQEILCLQTWEPSHSGAPPCTSQTRSSDLCFPFPERGSHASLSAFAKENKAFLLFLVVLLSHNSLIISLFTIFLSILNHITNRFHKWISPSASGCFALSHQPPPNFLRLNPLRACSFQGRY